MPFYDRLYNPIDAQQAGEAVPFGINQDEDGEGETPSFGETLRANFRINNTIASAIQSKRFGTSDAAADFDQEFNPWTAIQGTDFEEDWPAFVGARNAADLEHIKSDVLSEREARKVIDKSSLISNIVSGGLAGIADPLILAPGLAPVRGAKIGLSTLKTALATGALTMGVAGTQEALLHASQATRTLDESLVNTFTAGVVGSLLGGTFAKVMTRAEMDNISRKLIADVAAGPAPNTPEGEAWTNVVDAIGQFQASKQAQAGGSAAVPAPSIKDLDVEGKYAKALVKVGAFNPVARTLSVSSAVARDVMLRIAENSVYLSGAARGETPGAAAENLINLWRGSMSRTVRSHVQTYSDYVKASGNGRNHRWTRSEFNKEVGKALQDGDAHLDPHVTQAAKIWREQIFDPLTQRAIKAGLLPEDVKPATAATYFSRVWNRKALKAQEFKFKNTVKDYYRSALSKEGFDTPGEFESHVGQIADEVFNKLTGRGGDFSFDFQRVTVSARGPLKERTFNIPDRLVRPWLDMDVERVGGRFARIMAADVEIADKFPESVDIGTKRVTLHGPLKKIEEDYLKLREEVEANTDLNEAQKGKQLEKLNKEETRVKDDIQAVRDILRGTYSQASDSTPYARITRVAGQFAFIRMMGGTVVSSLPDVLRPMFVHGVKDYFSVMGKLALDPQFRKIAKREASFGAATGQHILDARMASYGDIVDPYLSDSPFERFMGNAARGFVRASGMAFWNDWQRMFASAFTENRVARNLLTDYGKLSDSERRYMAHIYIDQNMHERMRAQVEATGGLDQGFWHSGTEKWTDEEAKRTFWAGLNKDVNSKIVTPGAGDLPLFMRTPTGRMMMQFKSFVMASHQKAFIRALQDGRHGNGVGVLMATIGSIAVGMFISWLRAIETNRIDDLSANPGDWLAEGIDRSGMFSLMMEANNGIERIFPGVGLYGALEAPFDAPGTGGASRFGFRPPSSTFGGPSVGTADDLYRVFRGDENKMWTLLPGRTLPYIRPILEWGVKPGLSANE